MRCQMVILINLIPPKKQGVGEMQASALAMAKKYAGKFAPGGSKPITFIPLSLDESTCDKPAELAGAVLKLIEASGVAIDNPDQFVVRGMGMESNRHSVGGVGLYWACHGNSEMMGPGAEVLANITALLVMKGVYFRKINLNACRSGSRPPKSGMELRPSQTELFCLALDRALTQARADYEKTMLNGLAVAGYDYDIEMFDPDQPFYRNMQWINRGDRSKVDKGSYSIMESEPASLPANVEVIHSEANQRTFRTYVPVRPGWVPFLKELEEARARIGKSAQASGKKWLTPDEKSGRTPAEVFIEKEIASRSATLAKIRDYIGRKKVFLYDGKSFKPGTIFDWTDNNDIADMVEAVIVLQGSQLRKKEMIVEPF